MRRLLPILLLLCTPALGQPMRMLESSPAARTVMEGNRQEFFLRFDQPVDRASARLELVQGDTPPRALQPRLGAQPNTLYAIAGNLPPGTYALRWSVRSMRGGETTSGALEFTVR